MKKVKLKDIANIQIGIVLSRIGAKQLELIKQDVIEKVSNVQTYEYKTITLRSIGENGVLDLSQCDNFISREELTKRYLTTQNDILIRLFAPIKSCLINESNENLVAPSQFGIIRLKDAAFAIILPEYLHLIMQNKFFINQVEKLESGFQLRSIKTISVENAEIYIPDINTQKKLIDFNKLIIKKEKLLYELQKQEKIKNEIILEKLIKGEI